MASRFRDLDELYSRLLESVNVERGQRTDLRLDRMRSLCSALGDPQSSCPAYHVAGSKGKGSVSIMIARTLEAAGLRVGLYTSPHFISWKERISLAGDELPDALLLDAAEEVFAAVEAGDGARALGPPTFFELTTLIGFCAFRSAGCERIVLEVGLGGRLDSTNVVDPAASVITPIELEHTEWLGDTIAAIAFEKAGIVKQGRPCYIGALRPEAREVVAAAAAERGSALREAAALAEASEVEITPRGTSARISFAAGTPLAKRFPSGLRASTPLVGAVQADNMALAILAAAESEPLVGPSEAEAGLARSLLPARFQVLPLDPPVVLDGAHTPDSVAIAVDSFERLFPGPKALLFGCAEDKKHGPMAALLAPRFDRITLTRPGSFKATDLSAVEASFRRAGAEPRVEPDFAEAARSASAEAASLGMPLLVAGSFYLCAAAYGLLGPA